MTEDVGRRVVRGASRDVLGWRQRAWLGRRWLHHESDMLGVTAAWAGVVLPSASQAGAVPTASVLVTELGCQSIALSHSPQSP